MTVKERILSIRLAEKLSTDSACAEALGLSAAIRVRSGNEEQADRNEQTQEGSSV